MRKLYLLIIVLVVIGSWWAIDDRMMDARPALSVEDNGETTYHNNKFGFSLTLPKGWRMGDNRLGVGTLQFFNYPESAADAKSVFSPGQNKIEAVVSESDNDDGCNDNSEFHCRFITIKNNSKFIRFIIYGDPVNFPILDTLINSITWTKN